MQKTLDRFMSKVKVDEATGCWEWQGLKGYSGYGRFGLGGKSKRAHRVSYEIFVQPIADGMCVCHTCDNRCCVNPCHLFQGTNKQNTNDMIRKGRRYRVTGESNAWSKLTEREVKLVWSFFLRHPDVKGKKLGAGAFLARWFGVTDKAISAIKNKRTWTHIH